MLHDICRQIHQLYNANTNSYYSILHLVICMILCPNGNVINIYIHMMLLDYLQINLYGEFHPVPIECKLSERSAARTKQIYI